MPSFDGAGGRATYGSLQPTEIKTNDAETTALIERRRYYRATGARDVRVVGPELVQS
jgi:hypothetical protein